ncbi:MAG: hypothetical protein KGS45_09125 [Planctomycetes bacterium]|nr:hypothetical protein [Planctomycetota bacterium]
MLQHVNDRRNSLSSRSAREVLQTLSYFSSLDSLESRLLLSVPTFDGFVEQQWDWDGDESFRGGVLEVTATSEDNQQFYVEIWEDDGGEGNDLLMRSGVLTATSGGSTFRIPLFTDLASSVIPGDDGDGTIEIIAKAFDPEGNLLTTYNVTADPDVGALAVETAAADGGLVGEAPVAMSMEVVGGSTVVVGNTYTLRATGTAAMGMFYWVDVNANNAFDPTSEGAYAFNMALAGVNGTTGTYEATIKWPTALSAGPYTIIAIAYDIDGNLSATTVSTVVTVGSANQPPTVSNLVASAAVVTLGSSFTLTATASDDIGVSNVTFFFDANGNNAQDGSDSVLTTDFSADGGWTFSGIAQTAWGSRASASFGAIATDGGGLQSTPRFTALRLNSAPTVSNVTSSVSSPVAGTSVTFTATVADDVGVNAVTFFVDKDNSGAWTPGTDIDLGADFDAAGGWTRTAVVASNWGTGTVRIRATARDTDNIWGSSGGPASITPIALPVVNSVTASPLNVVSWGQTLTLTANVTAGTSAVAAVTFFFDLDSSGNFTAGDVDLGADFDGTNGWSISKVIPSWYGSGNARFVAAAKDTANRWSATNASTTVRLNAPPVVNSITANPANVVNWGQTLTLTATVTDDANQVRAVTFFFDLDSNGRFSAGDVDMGADFDGTNGWSITKVIPSWYGSGNAKFVASAVDQNDAWATVTRTAGVRLNAPPTVATLNSNLTNINWGDSFTLTATVTDDSSVTRAVTFFFDLDSNGRFSAGDVDMGADFDGTNGWSITRVLPQWYGNGPAKFVASAVDTDNAWSTTTRTINVTLIARPLIQGPPTFDTNPVARGSTTTLSVTSPNPTFVGAVTAFIDVNNDGVWSPGTDRDLGVFTRQGSSSTWSLLINVNSGSGFANAGAYTIRIDSRDTNGNWVYAKLTATLNVT